VRPGLSLVPYSASVYLVAAVSLGVAMLATGTPFAPYSSQVWALFLAMTAGPQFLGHTVINHLLGELKASIVSVALLAEAVGASILAFVVFGERPGIQVVVGGAVVLAGVAITVLAEAEPLPDAVETDM
jgi:drug/metabolite transporter (DMT)-like permease